MKYYLETAYIRVRKLLSKSHYDGCVYTNSKKKIEDYKNIIFVFDYPKYVHLGDQLFFKPLISRLKSVNSNIFVLTTASMEFIFNEYAKNNLEDYSDSLFISRDDLLPHLRNRFNDLDYFLYNTMSLNINEPISNHILNKFCDYYKLSSTELEISNVDYLDFDLVNKDKFNLLPVANIVILNNYTDSGKFRLSAKRRRQLLENIKSNKLQDDFVVHLGSQKDKDTDKNNYSGMVDLDLRGKASIEDLFFILSLGNIKTVYCHDTFIMHIANIYNQKICLLFRRFFKPNEYRQKTIVYKSLFKKDCSNIEVI